MAQSPIEAQGQTQSPAARVAGQAEEESAYYAESWKKGDSRKIKERKFTVKLDAQNPSFEAAVYDASESQSYKLVVTPYYYVGRPGKWRLVNRAPDTKDTRVNFWAILLFEPDETASLLVANRDPGGHTFHLENTFANLFPLRDEKWINVGFFGVPISSTRVIKVAGFYVVIKVNDFRVSPTNVRAFDWVELEIELTNTIPPLRLRRQ